MALEIERKFLVKNDTYKEMASEVIRIKQGYISANPEAVVRIRIANDTAYITIKGRHHEWIHDEWEYVIPKHDAEEMLELCNNILDKSRYIVEYKGYTWEVDIFHGCHEGLKVTEIELPEAEAAFEIPPFVGKEVTGDPRYYNSNLSKQ